MLPACPPLPINTVAGKFAVAAPAVARRDTSDTRPTSAASFVITNTK